MNHLTTWFGQSVDIDGNFLEPAGVVGEIEAAGLQVVSVTTRTPTPGVEYPSRRCYVLARR